MGSTKLVLSKQSRFTQRGIGWSGAESGKGHCGTSRDLARSLFRHLRTCCNQLFGPSLGPCQQHRPERAGWRLAG